MSLFEGSLSLQQVWPGNSALTPLLNGVVGRLDERRRRRCAPCGASSPGRPAVYQGLREAGRALYAARCAAGEPAPIGVEQIDAVNRLVEELTAELKDHMKVLLTGAGGFLGVAVGSALRATRSLGPRPGADPESSTPDGCTGRHRDLVAGTCATTDLDAALAGVDAVVHLAAVFRGDVMEQFLGTVVPTERLLRGDGPQRERTQLVLVSTLERLRLARWPRERSRRTRRSSAASTRARRLRHHEDLAGAHVPALCRRARLEAHRPAAGLHLGSTERPWVEGVGIRMGSTLLVNRPFRRLPLTHVESCAECVAL